jgi:hypothetical protein
MRRREWVALVVLAIAVVAAGFFVVDSSGTPRLAVPTAAPQGPAPTPQDVIPAPSGLPASTLPPPSAPWKVQFVSNDTVNRGAIIREASLSTLNLVFDGPAFSDLKDDAWGIDAAAGFILSPGRYAFVVEHTGPVDVFVENFEMARQGANPAGQSLRIEFESKGGVSLIRIVATDTAGPFRLKFATPDPRP